VKFGEEEELERQKFEERKLSGLKQTVDPVVMANLRAQYSPDQIRTHFRDYYLKFLKFVNGKQLSVCVGGFEPLGMLRSGDEVGALEGLLNEGDLRGHLCDVYFNEHEQAYDGYLQGLPFESRDG